MRKSIIVVIAVLALCAMPAMAQDGFRLFGNAPSNPQPVYDAIGVSTALSLGTAGAVVRGYLQRPDVLMADLIMCGQQANTGTIYMGPGLGELDGTQTVYTIGGTACDALDNATEATADAPVGFANNAFYVYGMLCEVSSSGTNGVTISGRTAAGALSPAMSCTIPTGETSCVDVLATPATVAAGATVAIQVVNTEDLSLQDAWCRWQIGFLE